MFLISSGVPIDNDIAAAHAGARSQVDDQIGRLNGRFVVLDDQHAVAQLFEAAQGAEQHVIVARMKTDGRLVENVADAAQIGAELGGEPNALRFAAGKRVGAPVEGQIRQADFGEEIQALLNLPENFIGHRLVARGVAVLGVRKIELAK